MYFYHNHLIIYYITILRINTGVRKMAIFLFCVFIFNKCIAYISHQYQMFCSLFSYAFSTFRIRNRKKRDRQAFRRRLDIVARVFVAEFFREGLFESGKVIFALHDTKWLSYVQNQYLSHQQHLYIMCISYIYVSKYL